MNSYFVAFLLALGTALLLTPVARRLGLRWRIVDETGARKIHSGSIPRLGGPAVAAATLLPLLLILLWNNRLAEALWDRSPQMLGLCVGSLLALLLGLYDDVRYVRARYKLLGQVAIAVVAFGLGVRVQAISLPMLGTLDMGAMALPVTVVWLVGVMNAVNLIDGMDGLCAGVVFIASATIFTVAALGENTVIAFVAASIAGSALGFLRYNFNPATIFLGDSGAYFFGFSLAAASIVGAQKATTTVALLVPLLAIGLPMMDTSLAVLRRMVQGAPLFAPDRGHIHHRLLASGLSQRRVALVLYGLSLVFAVAGIAIVFGQNWAAGLALSVVALVVVYTIRVLGLFRRPLHKPGLRPLFTGPVKAEELVIALPALLDALPTLEDTDTLQVLLARFGETADIAQIELELVDERAGSEATRWTWLAPVANCTESRRSPRLTAELELRTGDRLLGRWSLTWRSENGRVSRESDALLKLAAAMIASRLDVVRPAGLPRERSVGGLG